MATSNESRMQAEHKEYKQVKRDLIFVIVLNTIFFAGLIALYFVNRSSGAVDRFFESILKF